MKYSEFKLVENTVRLNEAEARIQHAEDIVFWEGSKGAVRALDSLFNLEKGGHTNVTIKWDGSPAIIFGRDENGDFVLTDKSGFGAKGYDGKAKSADDLEAMLKNRPGYARNPEGYGQFASNMKDIFDEYEKAVPKDLIGFFKGDLLYFNTPPVENGNFVFTPNIVTYTVDVNSDIGQRISNSKTGVVIHRYIDPVSGAETPVDPNIVNQFQGQEVLVFPPVTAQQPAQIEDENINNLKALVAQNAQAIDGLLDKNKLAELKISDFAQVLYTYTNQMGAQENLGANFDQWVAGSKLSDAKKQRIIEWVRANNTGFQAIWKIVTGIQQIKNDIINQFDSHDAPVKASINGDDGGEGYVLAHPQGDIKLVNRAGFTAANRAVQREGIDKMKMNEIVNEADIQDKFGMTPAQRKIADLGRVLMDQAATTKDDVLSNMMAKVGSELTQFGAPFGPRNLQDLMKKTGANEQVLQKLLAFAEKIQQSKKNIAKDHSDGGLDDTNDTDDDFEEPSDADMSMAADRAAMRARRK